MTAANVTEDPVENAIGEALTLLNSDRYVGHVLDDDGRMIEIREAQVWALVAIAAALNNPATPPSIADIMGQITGQLSGS
jgi:hypothetical protein